MAHIRKIGKSYQIQYYLNGRKRYKQLPPNTPRAAVEAEKKKLEADLALHKAGIKRFTEHDRKPEFLSVAELADLVLEARQHEVARETIDRNRYAMQLFMEVIGFDTLVSELKPSHLDRFVKARFEAMQVFYQQRGRHFNEDRVKRGINKDLENIRTVFQAAVKKEILPEKLCLKIEKLKVDRQRLPNVLTSGEIERIAGHLQGEAWLAFWIIRYTGARRSEIARKSLGDDRGLKWKHIDFERNTIRLYAKKKEKRVPMHQKLCELLLARKAELRESFDSNAHVISLVRETLSDYFARAIAQAGIDKPGAVHILRHTAATSLLESGANIREVQEFLGHASITTTEIYTHVVQDRLESAVNRAFA